MENDLQYNLDPLDNTPTREEIQTLIDSRLFSAGIYPGGGATKAFNRRYNQEYFVPAGGDIQGAIDSLVLKGGGIVTLENGTHVPIANIVLYSNILLRGQNAGSAIINFNSKSYGITLTGTSVYTTGTISSISGGVNVVGSGTAWTSSMAGQQIFINNRWYVITSVTDATHLIMASGYADGATFSGTYRISSVIKNAGVTNLTIQNSTTTAILGTDVRDFLLQDVNITSCNIGYAITNFMNIEPNRVLVASSTSDGYQLTNGSFFNAYNVASVSNGGNGITLNTIKSCTFIFSAADSNTGDGINATAVTNTAFKMECSSNGGQGIEFVSGCNGNLIDDELINSNTSDGIKLTATSSNNTIATLDITSNGGYGINIAAASCQNNIIVVPYYSGNVSGTLNDLGTSTQIVAANTVLSVLGTANRITSSGGQNPVIDISAAYVGQTSITTLGTIATGTWNASLITGTYGGTGVNNGTKTLTYLKNISFTAADDLGVYTLPTGTKTLLATDGAGTSLTGIPYTLTGTANQVILSAGTGNITFSLPQSIGTASSPQFLTIELGAASDTTIARSAAGAITVEGVQVILSGAALGTPLSGTLTNCTGLPVSGITASTVTALGVGSLELGHASDTTLSRSSAGVLAVEGVVIPSISSTNTLTNKRITWRSVTTTQSATPTINTDNTDVAYITGLAQAITSFTTNLSGTPNANDKLIISITDNGTARAITWGTSFESSGNVTLPTTTVISVRLDVGFLYNTATSKWRCVAIS